MLRFAEFIKAGVEVCSMDVSSIMCKMLLLTIVQDVEWQAADRLGYPE